VNVDRKNRFPLPVVAATLLLASVIWYCALILNLRGIVQFAGLRFFWTAALGLGPFLCLGLTVLLLDRHLHDGHTNKRLVYAATTAGLSPWLWSLAALWFGVR
jgi:hypothetical protein